MIHWDKNKERNDSVSELPQRLLRSKCNPVATHSRSSWIFDIEIINN